MYRLKCINVSSIILSLLCIGSVVITFIFSQRVTRLEEINGTILSKLSDYEDFKLTEKNRVKNIIDMVSGRFTKLFRTNAPLGVFSIFWIFFCKKGWLFPIDLINN